MRGFPVLAHRPVEQYFRTLAPNFPNWLDKQDMGISELVMASSAQTRVKGCGKTGQTFTLYHVNLIDGSGRALSQGFKNLSCGSCASTFQKMTYGIVLCPACAEQLGFAPLARTKAPAPVPAKSSRS